MALKREACERRVYRLAALLTGDPAAACRVAEAVVHAQPDLRRLDSARLDRLTVLRSREMAPAVLVHDAVPAEIAAALARLDAQPREAWVLSDVYGLSLRETARAMDCSSTATSRHLDRARRGLERSLGERLANAAESLQACSATLALPAIYHQRRARRRLARGLLVLAALGALIALLLWGADRISPG